MPPRTGELEEDPRSVQCAVAAYARSVFKVKHTFRRTPNIRRTSDVVHSGSSRCSQGNHSRADEHPTYIHGTSGSNTFASPIGFPKLDTSMDVFWMYSITLQYHTSCTNASYLTSHHTQWRNWNAYRKTIKQGILVGLTSYVMRNTWVSIYRI